MAREKIAFYDLVINRVVEVLLSMEEGERAKMVRDYFRMF